MPKKSDTPPALTTTRAAQKLPDVHTHVCYVAAKANVTLASVARSEQRDKHFYQRALQGGNPRIEVLIELSRDLNHNLLHLYLPLLPTNIRPTPAEAAIRQENEALRAELEKLKQENAKLWGVVAGRP